uniref:Niban apoptosis regulator 2a n=1 Tax=Callorhinchus milii TaxID=7868 RepID=A0A4W3HEJ2_CALMI
MLIVGTVTPHCISSCLSLTVEEVRVLIHILYLLDWKREISKRTGKILQEFFQFYEDQYPLALFNKIRYEVEENGGPQPQLLERKVPLKDKLIFSGNLYQYMEDSRKWKNRHFVVHDDYNILFYDRSSPKGVINFAGYKVLNSADHYMELLSASMPGIKGKASSSPFLKWPTEFRTMMWHPYGRHFYFFVLAEKEQQKWQAVFQDCVRHLNNGLPEDSKVETPAFSDAVRLYRQSKDQYGTWDMLCGNQVQIMSNLVMEELLPELGTLIHPRLKGKVHDRQRAWILITEAVYKIVQQETRRQYEAVLQKCELSRPGLESRIRTDMDQIINSKEHVANKIRAFVMPKAEACVRSQVQPYIGSILDALMAPTSRGFAEVRDVFFKETVEMNMNVTNEGSQHKLGEHMERLTLLPYHPVKMQSGYEKLEQLQPQLEGLQQRFDLSSPAVFVQRGQILMRQQMDNAVYTFEQLLHQNLEKSSGKEDLCKIIQRIQERVLKKYDYDSSTVRKRFFREALLQITIPYLLKKLSPSVNTTLPKFQEFIFEDFSKFILVDHIFEEVVLQSVSKDIMMAVKEAAVQRKHNLFRDSIVITGSDPNLHLLGEGPPIDWSGEFGGPENSPPSTAEKRKRMKQVVSMIQEEGVFLRPDEVQSMGDLKEEPESQEGPDEDVSSQAKSPDSVKEIRDLLPVITVEKTLPTECSLSNGIACQDTPAGESRVEEESERATATETSQVPAPSSSRDSGFQSPSDEEQRTGAGDADGATATGQEPSEKVTVCKQEDQETGEGVSSSENPIPVPQDASATETEETNTAF